MIDAIIVIRYQNGYQEGTTGYEVTVDDGTYCDGGYHDRATALESAVCVLAQRCSQLKNDARYWDLARTYGEASPRMQRYLRSCGVLLEGWE